MTYQNPSKILPKSAALLAAPGVLNPTALYACINILHFLSRGDHGKEPAGQNLSCWGHVGTFFALGALFFALGRFLGASLTFFAHLGRFFRVWGCSWLVFSSPRERWGSIFEVKALTFSMFFRCARVRCASCVEHGLLQAPPCKSPQNTMRNACRSFRPIRRERPKNNFQRVWSTIRRR